MYGSGAQEASREEQEMPPPINAGEGMEEPTSEPIPVLTSSSELPIQSKPLPLTTTTTFEGIPRESDQLVTTTETTEPRPSIPDTREERRNGQPPPASTITMAQVSPLPTATTWSESSDLIWSGHPDG